MKAPTQGGRCGEAKDHGRALILNFRKAPRKFNYCATCDAPFLPAQPWHALCQQCFTGSRLYAAIVRYQAAAQ